MGQSLAMTPSSVGRDPIQRGLDRLQRWLWDNLQRFNKTIARICTWKCRKTWPSWYLGKIEVLVSAAASDHLFRKCGSLWDGIAQPKTFPSSSRAGRKEEFILEESSRAQHYLCPAEPLPLLLAFSGKKMNQNQQPPKKCQQISPQHRGREAIRACGGGNFMKTSPWILESKQREPKDQQPDVHKHLLQWEVTGNWLEPDSGLSVCWAILSTNMFTDKKKKNHSPGAWKLKMAGKWQENGFAYAERTLHRAGGEQHLEMWKRTFLPPGILIKDQDAEY